MSKITIIFQQQYIYKTHCTVMSSEQPLKNFVKTAAGFLGKLKKNNNRDWFQNHKTEFEESVMEPAQEFVFLMGKQLEMVIPGIIADPKINRSIFRLNRDTRFSSDKTPYKTNLGIYFWEGKQSRLATSGFFFTLNPDSLCWASECIYFQKNNYGTSVKRLPTRMKEKCSARSFRNYRRNMRSGIFIT